MSGNQPVAVIGRYALYDEIAAGGMAKVHLGRLLGPVGFARTVAIKRLHQQYARDPEFVSMFLDEARLAARIRHPHVVPTLDVVALSGELFLVMDYVHGVSLSKLMRAVITAKTRVPVEVVASILVGALHGLHAAHEARSERGLPLGIVHRDVSPQNIMIGSDGMSRVLDFGVAKASWRIQTTRDGQLKGKLSYMAPEQVNGGTVGPWTDVYSAAIVFWEALTNQRLFNKSDSAAVLARFTKDEPVEPPSVYNDQVSPALDAIVVKALQNDVAKRYVSAREMADDIEANVQLASSSAVTRWVQSIVHEELDKHSSLIAEIENGSSASIRPQTPSDDRPSVRKLLASIIDITGKDAETKTFVPPVDAAGDPTSHSQISMTRSPSAQVMVPADRRKRLLQWGSVGGGALGLVVLLLVLTHSHEAPTPLAMNSALATSSTITGPAPAPPPVLAAQAPPPEAPLTAIPSAAPSLRATATQKVAVHASVHPAASSACNPPYTVDSRGIRHMKLACLH